MIAACFASLVHDDSVNLEWSTPLKDLVPEFSDPNTRIRLPELRTTATLEDLLSMRLGLPLGNSYWMQMNQQLLLPQAETARIVGGLAPLDTHGSGRLAYSNWCYALAGEILEQLTGLTLEQATNELLFGPLGLGSTTFGNVSARENLARSYITQTNLTPVAIPSPPVRSGTVMAAAGGVKSSLGDLLKYYRALLKAASDQARSGHSKPLTKDTSSPFVDIHHLWTPHASIDPGNYSSHYGLGWVITSLPSQAGLVGINPYLLPPEVPLPILALPGSLESPVKLVYHNGLTTGALSAVYLLPETQTAIVVLSNTFALSDATDWIAQFLVEVILAGIDNPNVVNKLRENDFVQLAKAASENSLTGHPATQKILLRERVLGTQPSRELGEYAGRYWNSGRNFYLDVIVLTKFQPGGGEDLLRLTVQGKEETRYDLKHYHHDVFWWECGDRDKKSRLAIWPHGIAPEYHRVAFHAGEFLDDGIKKLTWGFDGDHPGVNEFMRE
ncbi:beta-lactamase/transpeptidase-like protein [Podospora australis]|uniref:Beta-lactamase/transpeptidase-like protein n=1 Tax=Podospora australis TaxID=1536484 RepID=A0AAN7AC98_9PEZI|nr:beta-lactamase/transpeptidase-like protein [Podospora australis]